jgi:hypothetical protein
VENYVEQQTVDLQSAVVMDETQFPEPVHEKADSRASGVNHLGQRLLTDLGNHGFRNTLLAKMRQQKDPGAYSIVQNYVEQRTVDLQSAFNTAGVLNETQSPEPVHEKTHS